MAFSITNSFTTGDVIDADKVNANFDDVEAMLNGGLTNANLSGTAGITNANLANSKYEVVLNMTVPADRWQGSSSGNLVAAVGLPGDAADEYTIKQIDYMWVGVADITGSPAFSIDFAYYNGGTYTVTTQVVGPTAIPLTTTNTTGKATIGTSTVTPSTSNQHFFTIFMDEKGSASPVFTADVGFLTVSIKLVRTNGLRS